MINTRHMTKIDETPTSEMNDATELVEMALEATHFLQWHHWCRTVKQGYLDCGWPGILAVFYFEIEPASPDVDDAVWVVVGDIPPAYMDSVNCRDGMAVLQDYLYAMREWVDHTKAGQPVNDLIPVYRRHSLLRVQPTIEYAQMLETRLDFIQAKVLPEYQEVRQ